MRDFIDSILAGIGAASLNDEEWEIIESDVEDLELGYSQELYTSVLLVLDSREAVSSERDRLTYYFKAKGAELSSDEAPALTDQSKIFVGDDLG